MKEYFSHDYHARADEKIIKMLKNMGPAGYGIYWMLVEMIYEGGGSISKDYELIAYDLRVPVDRIKMMCEDFGLFNERDNRIFSKSVERRLEERAEKSVKAKKSVMKRWAGAYVPDTNVSKSYYDTDTNVSKPYYVPDTNVGVLKESKVKKRREEGEGIGFRPPTILELKEYAEAEHLTADVEKFQLYHSSKGWKGMVDWKAALRYWDKTEFIKNNPPQSAYSKPKEDPLVKHYLHIENTKKTNDWHDLHTKNGKCAFCKTELDGISICTCKKYSEEFEKFKESLKHP
jgi:hypothetical protein